VRLMAVSVYEASPKSVTFCEGRESEGRIKVMKIKKWRMNRM
jgi:hypothetical protein